MDACDVLVIGSGSAACSAALRTARGGLRVLVIEKSEWLGGTSAMSGSGVWIPANHLAAADGISDTREDAITYLLLGKPDDHSDRFDIVLTLALDGSWTVTPRAGTPTAPG